MRYTWQWTRQFQTQHWAFFQCSKTSTALAIHGGARLHLMHPANQSSHLHSAFLHASVELPETLMLSKKPTGKPQQTTQLQLAAVTQDLEMVKVRHSYIAILKCKGKKERRAWLQNCACILHIHHTAETIGCSTNLSTFSLPDLVYCTCQIFEKEGEIWHD